jgi:hypothetical protein
MLTLTPVLRAVKWQDVPRRPARAYKMDGVQQHSGRPTRAPERDESRPTDCTPPKQKWARKTGKGFGMFSEALGFVGCGGPQPLAGEQVPRVQVRVPDLNPVSVTAMFFAKCLSSFETTATSTSAATQTCPR